LENMKENRRIQGTKGPRIQANYTRTLEPSNPQTL
jgi:hypothetical protein